MIPVIAIAFVLVVALLLWFVIGSDGPWWLKLPVLVSTCLFTFAVWDALDSFSGWPTAETPPARSLLLSSTVDEPRAIYLWLIAPRRPGLLDYRAGAAEPRSYRLPYTRQLHQQVDRANQLAKQGLLVELRRQSTGRPGRQAPLVVRRYRLPGGGAPRKEHSSAPSLALESER